MSSLLILRLHSLHFSLCDSLLAYIINPKSDLKELLPRFLVALSKMGAIGLVFREKSYTTGTILLTVLGLTPIG